MTASQIITNVYLSKDLDTCIKSRVRPWWFPGGDRDWWDELKAETFKIICEQPPELIEKIYQENKINFFVGRIIINLAKQDRNSLQKPYEKGKKVPAEQAANIEQLPPDYEAEHEFNQQLEKFEQLKATNNSGYYYGSLIELYSKYGSYRAVSNKTGIPVMSVRDAVIRGRKILINEI